MKVVQRVPVRIHLRRAACETVRGPSGMSAEVTVDTRVGRASARRVVYAFGSRRRVVTTSAHSAHAISYAHAVIDTSPIDRSQPAETFTRLYSPLKGEQGQSAAQLGAAPPSTAPHGSGVATQVLVHVFVAPLNG